MRRLECQAIGESAETARRTSRPCDRPQSMYRFEDAGRGTVEEASEVRPQRRGFTLTGLLGMVATVGILAATVFPVFDRVREIVCRSGVNNVTLAIQMCLADNCDAPPPKEHRADVNVALAQNDDQTTGEPAMTNNTPAAPVRPSEQFRADGNSDPDRRAARRKVGEVVVTFDLLPTSMSFNLPAYPFLVTENGIRYCNEWVETYDVNVRPDSKAAGADSMEPAMDQENRYTRMWIESQNEARIVVRTRGALCNPDGIIAHANVPSGSPYGDGDWMDEWYIIYPDGVHIRKSRVYTFYAAESRPFGWKRTPPNYVHEFQEIMFKGDPGHLPEDDIETEALTLIKMNGARSTISYDPYPIHWRPTEEELYASFGEFSNANIVVINTKSEYRPFVIARPDNVTVSPYTPDKLPLPRVFQCWPATPRPDQGYGMALGHIINWEHYQKTKNTLTQIYLSGWTNSRTPWTELLPRAKSWLHPAEMKFPDEKQAMARGYDPAQGAYLIDSKTGTQSGVIHFELAASEDSPIVNPVFLVNNWGAKGAVLEIDGSVMDYGSDFRLGHYGTLDVDDGRAWKGVLVVWVQMDSFKPVRIRLSPASFHPDG